MSFGFRVRDFHDQPLSPEDRATVAGLGIAERKRMVDDLHVPLDGFQRAKEFIRSHHFPVTGAVSGHGDTYRIIYFNDLARTFNHAGRYPVGTVMVKEIYDHEGGKLLEINAMRKVDAVTVSTDGGGWLFTDVEGKSEKSFATCFATCHKQAPYDAAWFDYGDN